MKNLIPEENLNDFFENDGRIFLESCRTSDHFTIAPGKALYYELYRSPKKSHAHTSVPVIVLCHGFTETCCKYSELIYYFLCSGFDVFTYDQRGHGRSFREISNPSIVHVRKFDEDYVNDLQLLIENVVKKAFPDSPFYLFGHSMGGCVALRYIELYPEVFKRCILSSPMVGIKTGAIPLPCARALALFMKLIGKGTSFLPGHHDYRPDETFEESASTSYARFSRYNKLRKSTPEFQLSAGDYAWFAASTAASAKAISAHEAARATIPVLLCEAESDSYVRRDRVRKLRANLPDVHYHFYQGSRHEIFSSTNEVFSRYLQDIFDFLTL